MQLQDGPFPWPFPSECGPYWNHLSIGLPLLKELREITGKWSLLAGILAPQGEVPHPGAQVWRLGHSDSSPATYNSVHPIHSDGGKPVKMAGPNLATPLRNALKFRHPLNVRKINISQHAF